MISQGIDLQHYMNEKKRFFILVERSIWLSKNFFIIGFIHTIVVCVDVELTSSTKVIFDDDGDDDGADSFLYTCSTSICLCWGLMGDLIALKYLTL